MKCACGNRFIDICEESRTNFIRGLWVVRSSVGPHRQGRALLGYSIKRPGGDLTVIRGRWAPLAYPRVADAVRRRRVVVVTPEVFVKVCERAGF